MLRIADFLLALLMVGGYLGFLYKIVSITTQIISSDKDTLLKTHYKTKFKNWLFIVEPLVDMKSDKPKENITST